MFGRKKNSGDGAAHDPDGAARTDASDGLGDPTVEAEGELALARMALAGGELKHAAEHIGGALASDPAFGPAYVLIGELVTAAGGPDRALELFDVGGDSVFIGAAVAAADVQARRGELGAALLTLARVTAADPKRPWSAAPWFGPQLAARLAPIEIGRAVARISGRVPDPAPPQLVALLTPWLELCRAVAARPDAGSTVPATPVVLSGLARRLGAADEAIAWCEAAERAEHSPGGTPTFNTPVMLGYALRSAGRPAEAMAAWQRALALDPGNVDLHIDLAETCLRQDDPAGAVAWAERAEAIDPAHLKPKAVKQAALFQASAGTDADPLVALADLARANPEHEYPRQLLAGAARGRPWLHQAPYPSEAIAHALNQIAADHRERGEPPFPSDIALRLSGVEAPSAVAALRAWFPQTELEVLDSPEPDARRPVREDFGPPLWIYEGMTARAAVPPASPLAAEALYKVATGFWPEPLAAYDGALGLAGLGADELLGLLAHVPPAPNRGPWASMRWEAPAYWPRFAQAWTCLGILHHAADQSWAGSERRAMLLRLLFGPEDWTVDAAAFALCVHAWLFPEQRQEVAALITERYLETANAVMQRACELHDPLARVLLACPGVVPDARELARDMLARRAESAEPDPRDLERVPEAMREDALRAWAQQDERAQNERAQNERAQRGRGDAEAGDGGAPRL